MPEARPTGHRSAWQHGFPGPPPPHLSPRAMISPLHSGDECTDPGERTRCSSMFTGSRWDRGSFKGECVEGLSFALTPLQNPKAGPCGL